VLWFWWTVIVLAFLLALGQNGFLFPFLYNYVPTFAFFQAPARYLIWAVTGLAILGAYGIERWRCPEKRGLYWLRLATAGAFAVTLGAGLAWLSLDAVKSTFIRATALAGLWGLGLGILTLLQPWFEKRGWHAAWNCAAFGWLLLDLLVAGWNLNPMISTNFYNRENPQAVQIREQLQGQRVYIPAEDLQALKFKRFLRFQDFSPLEDWFNMRAVLIPNLNLLDQVAYANNFDPLVPGRYPLWLKAVESASPLVRERWLQAAGVGLIEAVDPSRPSGVRFDPLPVRTGFEFFTCAESAQNVGEVIARFEEGAASHGLVLEGVEVSNAVCADPTGFEARVLSQTADRVVLALEAPADGWLSSAMTFYPGWRATVDGQPAGILRANLLFMAVPVPKGDHQIILQFRPMSFYLGGLLSILILLLITIQSAMQRRQSRVRTANHNGEM